jgi:threonine dehydrogenase-like Zn-dependent dehydrogenase
VYPVPDDLTSDQAVLVEPMAVGVHAVLRRPPAAGERVLILGSGIIGLLTLQAARALAPEANITVLARYPHQAEAARRFGATEVVNRGDYRRMATLTDAKYYSAPMNKGMVLGGFDVIYDCVGSGRTVEDSLRWARAGGTVVIVGVNLAPAGLDLTPVWYQEVNLIGAMIHGADEWRGRRAHTYDIVYDLLRDGRLCAEGLITHRFPFTDYKRAIATAMDKRGAAPIKVVFDLG